jgi:glycosyltransferase involved in cell wall biosynthesis
MAIRLLHVVDDHTGEDAARLCSLLLRRLPAGEVRQQVVLMGRTPEAFSIPPGVARLRVQRPLTWPLLWALGLQRALAREAPEVTLAWSPVAAAAVSGGAHGRVAGVACDPGEARDWGRWQNALRGTARAALQVVCTSRTAERRLAEAGIAVGAMAVVSPGVDFREIRVAREQASRARLGLPGQGRILVTPSPPTRAGGQFVAAWAAALLHHSWPDAVLVVPGLSRERERIMRLVRNIYCPEVFVATGYRFSPAEILAVADALVVPARADTSTGWIPQAMAAGVPVVASAVPAITEYIADRVNGFLVRTADPHTLATRIRTAMESGDVLAQIVRTARQQAYDAFRAERCVDEFLRVIRNLAERRPIAAGAAEPVLARGGGDTAGLTRTSNPATG